MKKFALFLAPLIAISLLTNCNNGPKLYTVTVSSEDTSKGSVSGGGPHAYGTSVTITATPNDGYKFNGWYEGTSKISSSTSYTFTMPAKDITYTANFTENAWYVRSDWWDYCSNGKDGEQAVTKDIGKEVNLTVNNQVHKVRLIGVNHDDLYNETGKAHCTFEFVNLLSDSSGYSLATLWDTSNKGSSTNHDYLNSDLRKALDGSGSGMLRWYQKESPIMSTTYTTSVYDMLPNDLQRNIKTAKKYVATTSSYDVTNYDARVFALTHNEMTTSSSSYSQAEGTTYQYYKEYANDSSRIKHQIKGHVGAVASYKKITDLDWHPRNYAGYNDSRDSYGCDYWLASPSTHYNDDAWNVSGDGGLYYYYVYGSALAVAPAFCI